MRAVKTEVCTVCGRRTSSKSAMEDHAKEDHGKNWAPAQLTRAEDQGEFRPCLRQTPWGEGLR